jgi:tetratricopeptide (TPR) repeat protein
MNKNILCYLALILFVIAPCDFSQHVAFGQGPKGEITSPQPTPESKIKHTVPVRQIRRLNRKLKRPINKAAGPRWVGVLIVSDPPGSTIFFDDDTREVTDSVSGMLDVELLPGSYNIQVSHSGYTGKRVHLEITETSSDQDLKVKLEPIQKALKVITDPPRAEVYLDDTYKGVSSLEGVLSIEPVDLTKSHLLRAEKSGFPPSKNITVAPNTSEVTFKLSLDLITLKVTTDPPEMEVYLDEAYKGASNSDGLLLIEQVNSALPHTLRGRKAGYIKDGTVPVPINNPQATIKLQPDPLVVSAKAIKQQLAAGRLSDALGAYLKMAQEMPDYEDLPRLLDSILQALQARSSSMIAQMGPYGLLLSVEEAQEMNQLYEQARQLRQGDSEIAGLAEYWKMKSLVTRAKHTSVTSEREALLRTALKVAPVVEAFNSQNAYLLFDSAWVYSMLGDNATAKKGYEQTQKLNPNWAFSYYALGLMDMNAGDLEKSNKFKKVQYLAGIDKFTKAISVKPDFFQAYMMRCLSYSALKLHLEAIANGQQATAMRPQNAFAHFALGFAYYQKGKPEFRNALNEFERALSLTEDEPDQGTKASIQLMLVRIKKSLGIKR